MRQLCERTGRKKGKRVFVSGRNTRRKMLNKKEGGAEPWKEENLNRKQRWIKGNRQPCDGGFFFFSCVSLDHRSAKLFQSVTF